MSILSSLLRDVAALFFPPRCPVCGRMLAQGEHTVCTLCRATAPLTGFCARPTTPCWGGAATCCPWSGLRGCSIMSTGQRVAGADPGFKYRGAWRTARAMGEWYGRCLKESGLYDDVEVVVPLPLTPSSAAAAGTTSPNISPKGLPRSWAWRSTAAACAGSAIRRARPSRRAETGPAMSRMRSPSSVPGGLRGGTSCWWTTCSPRQHDAFVRRGDSALGARLPHQHRRARRLAARSGREGVGCGNYFSTGRTFPQGGAGPKLC